MRRFLFALFLVTATVALCTPPAIAQSGEDLFQQAVRTERLSGNMEAAIALYEQIVEEHGDDRELSAKALLQLARAYEALGRTEARRAYGRLVNDYADYPEVLVEARAGYERTREPVAEAVTKQEPLSRTVVALPEWFNRYDSSVSPSGRYLVGATWGPDQPPGVGLIDIQTGAQHLFPVQIEPEREGWNPRMSPDESRIALSWLLSQWSTDLVLVDVASGEHEVVFDSDRYYTEERGIDVQDAGVRPHQWSADGNRILLNAVVVARGERVEELAVLDLTTGTFEVFATGETTREYAWEKMCWSADERYVFADFWKSDIPELVEYIRRFDTQTGEIIDWRRQEGADFRLAACDWDRNEVVYTASGVGSLVLQSASPADLDHTDDPVLSRLNEDQRMALGNVHGDLVSWQETFATLYVAQWDSATGRLAGSSQEIARTQRRASWSPSGNELLWTDFGENETIDITIWSREGKRVFDGMPPPLGLSRLAVGVRWLEDGNIQYHAAVENASRQDTVQNFNVLQVDRWTGEATLVGSAEDAVDLGVIWKWSSEPGVANMWNSERECLQRLDLDSKDLADWACFEPGYLMIADDFQLGPRFPSTASSSSGAYIFQASRADGLLDVGLLHPDEDAPRVVTIDPRDEDGGTRRYLVSPLPDGRLLLHEWRSGRQEGNIEALNLETGARTPMFTDLEAQMWARHVAVNPQGNQIAVVGLPGGVDANSVTVIHNVLGNR